MAGKAETTLPFLAKDSIMDHLDTSGCQVSATNSFHRCPWEKHGNWFSGRCSFLSLRLAWHPKWLIPGRPEISIRRPKSDPTGGQRSNRSRWKPNHWVTCMATIGIAYGAMRQRVESGKISLQASLDHWISARRGLHLQLHSGCQSRPQQTWLGRMILATD